MVTQTVMAVVEGPEPLVATPADRSTRSVARLLGIFGARAVAVPVDVEQQVGRTRQVMATASPAAVLPPTSGGDGQPSPHAAVSRAAAHDLAYVMFTSGSAGCPKGVDVEHGALDSYVAEVGKLFGIVRSDRVLATAPLTFDASLEELLVPLTHGASVVLAADGARLTPDDIARSCEREGVTVLSVPTATFHEMALARRRGEAVLPPNVRLVVVGGDLLVPELVADWIAAAPPGLRLLDMYGPTEAVISATAADVRVDWSWTLPPSPSIGRPLSGIDAVVRDAAAQECPDGVTGELWVAGRIARGYRGLSGPGGSGFQTDGTGRRWYRTGDLVQRRPDGRFVFIGREDEQVQVRGHRVELAELRVALDEAPSIALADLRAEVRPGRHDTSVVARIELAEGADLELARAELAAALPSWMLPDLELRDQDGAVVLPVPDGHCGAVPLEWNDLERSIGNHMAALLGMPRLLPDEDFFAHGGDSLLAMRLLLAVEHELGVTIAFRELFAAPTATGVAELVRERASSATADV